MRVKYQLTREFTDAEFVATGQRPAMEQTLELDLKSATPDQRAALLTIGFRLNTTALWVDNRLGTPVPGTNGPHVSVEPLVADHYLTADEAWQFITDMAAAWPGVKAEAEARAAERQRQQQAENALRAQQEQARQQAAAARAAARRAALLNIAWADDGTAIHDLYDALVEVSDVAQDDRFQGNWVKRVTGVRAGHDDGYDIEGEWVNTGTVELRRGQQQVFLVAGTTGSRKYQTTTYQVVVLTAEGTFEKPAIRTTSAKPGWVLRIRDTTNAQAGWVLRIRDQVKALLA